MKNAKSRRGFSLIEVLVVIVIISILAGVVVVNIMDEPGKAKQAACKANIQVIKTALKLYKLDHGVYPNQAQGLEALIVRPTHPPVPDRYPEGGYLDTPVLPTDPWKNPFLYLIPGRSGEKYEVLSYGSDGEPGGVDEAADVSSSDPN